MNIKIIIPLAFLVLLTAGGCGGGRAVQTEESETIIISGAFGLYPMVMIWADKFMEIHPDVMFEISPGGAGKGMIDVMVGITNIAMLSRPLTENEVSQGAVIFPVAKDAVVAIVSADNPFLEKIMARGISSESARKIWIDKSITTWGQFLNINNNTPLKPYSRFDAGGGPDTWAAWFGAKHIDMAGKKVFGDTRMLPAVAKDKNAIGFISMTWPYDKTTGALTNGVVVLPVDINGDGHIDAEENNSGDREQIVAAIKAGIYPAPPSRELYLVTNGVPTNPTVIEFIKFVLTEGQKYNLPAGFVEAASNESEVALGLLRN